MNSTWRSNTCLLFAGSTAPLGPEGNTRSPVLNLNEVPVMIQNRLAEPVGHTPECRNEPLSSAALLGRVCPECSTFGPAAVAPVAEPYLALAGKEVVAQNNSLEELLADLEGVFDTDNPGDLAVWHRDSVVLVLHPDGSQSVPQPYRIPRAALRC